MTRRKQTKMIVYLIRQIPLSRKENMRVLLSKGFECSIGLMSCLDEYACFCSRSGWFPRTYLDFSNDQDAVDRLRRNRELPTAPSHQQMPNLPRPDY
eukprot:m.110270 g.110270  ORF g.110270 m.110270 type:complete len:97 (-) comp15266_c0_seq1:141-431(-)